MRSGFLAILLVAGLAAVPRGASAAPGGPVMSGAGRPERLAIPFSYRNGFIVVELRLNRVLPLSFIFDTGARHTVLTDGALLPLLGAEPGPRIEIVGSDMSRRLAGRLMRRTILEVGEVELLTQSLIVLDNDEVDLAEITGEQVHGILGAGTFAAYAITIDYRRERIFLEPSGARAPSRRSVTLPLDIEQGKPYITLATEVHPGFADSLRYLIDTGAALSLMLSSSPGDSALYPAQLIPGAIGTGLGGDLFGYVGRSDSLSVGRYDLADVITHFDTGERDRPGERDVRAAGMPVRSGLIGNQLLDRFRVTLDYPARTLHLTPIKRFRRVRPYDRSGLRIVNGGPHLRRLQVQLVVPGSPAHAAGLRVGDRITRVNGIPTGIRGLAGVRRALRGRPGKTVRLTVDRGGTASTFKVHLRDLI